jgi:hypothetical protein
VDYYEAIEISMQVRSFSILYPWIYTLILILKIGDYFLEVIFTQGGKDFLLILFADDNVA